MGNKYNKTKISAMFDSQYGYTVKVTPEVLAALASIKEGGYLNLSRVKDETRSRIASERNTGVERTVAAYLEFSELDKGASEEIAAAPKAKARIERF